MTDHNAPLTEPVLNLLQSQLLSIICTAGVDAGQPIEEQYLLSRLGLKLHSDAVQSEDMHRFSQHFVLYHLLFRLQQQLLVQQQSYLSIDLAKVRLLPVSQAPERYEQDDRRQYYLRWQNFYLMTEQLLDQYLNDFWQQLITPKNTQPNFDQAEAIALLQLPAQFNLVQLKKAYRTKALQLHPDRGGQQQQFILLQQAYQRLLQQF